MDNQKLESILNQIFEEMITASNDKEYKYYLEEKRLMVLNYAKEHNLSVEEVLSRIKSYVPEVIEQYNRMKETNEQKKNSSNSKFGVSICFEVIDLIEISKQCNNSEEFVKLRDEYIKKLGEDPRFQGFDYVFPGLREITYEEINKIYENLSNNVDCITPEWSGKMRCIIDIRKPLFVDGDINKEIFNFEYLDKMANFARSNNMHLRMHNIVWHLDFRPIFENATSEQIYRFLDVYMEEIARRYSDILYSVDVLNEIASEIPGKMLRDSKWKDKLGDDYYINILKIAKKHFPNIDVIYNEYGEENPEKRKNIIAIIEKIKEVEERDGIILLDGLGIQSHYSVQTPDQSIKEAYADFVKLGKKLQVTEFDVSNKGNQNEFNYQTNRVFRTVLDCAATFGIDLFNIWGVSSKISWKSGKVDNFLDKNGNISKYSSKVIETYSEKKKTNTKNDSLNSAEIQQSK